MKKANIKFQKDSSDNSIRKYFDRKTVIVLAVIGIISLLIRLHYTPFNLPIVLDGLGYFFYASDTSILGRFPSGYGFPNNGWPAFLSIFFYFTHSENFLDYMAIQRIVAMVLSAVTIVPVYLLCRRFVEKFYSIIGASLFVLEPRIMINSILGITEASYLLLGVTSLFFFLSKSTKMIYVSFALTGLFALIRYEGLLIIIPFSIMFFIRFRKKNHIIKYLIALGIFVLVLLPMAMIRIDTTGQDGLISHIRAGTVAHSSISQYSENKNDDAYYQKVFSDTIINLIKFGGWVTVPTFIVFMFLAVILVLQRKKYQNLDHKKLTIIMYSVFMIIPALYAYSRDIQETRYLYFLFPVFSILSFYGVEFFERFVKRRSVLMAIIIVGVIISSTIYLENKESDVKESEEQYQVAKLISQNIGGINPYSGAEYIKIAQISNHNFPILRSEIAEKPKIIPTGDAKSLNEFIELGRKKHLTHIIAEKQGGLQPEFISELFTDYEKISYLSIELDSKSLRFEKDFKLFRIDYESFDSREKT